MCRPSLIRMIHQVRYYNDVQQVTVLGRVDIPGIWLPLPPRVYFFITYIYLQDFISSYYATGCEIPRKIVKKKIRILLKKKVVGIEFSQRAPSILATSPPYTSPYIVLIRIKIHQIRTVLYVFFNK